MAVLFALKALGVIRLNLAWKLSPIAWMLFLFVALFIPMQWGAPAGPVGVFYYVVEIVPAVSGQVTEVPVKPLTAVKKGDVLFQIDPRPFEQEVGRLSALLADAEQQPALLESAVKIAEATVAKTKAEQERAQSKLVRSRDLASKQAITPEELDEVVRTATVADLAVVEANAQLDQAKLQQSAVTAEGENTAIAQARESLARAKYDLEHTTVRAPADGIVQQLALRPGTRVAAFPLRAALVFIDTDQTRVSLAVEQNQLRYVKPGQGAEVVLKYLPGMTLRAEVVGIAPITSGGQVQSSGVVEDVSLKQQNSEPYQVVLKIIDDRVDANHLPGGAVGTATIYTDHVEFTHVIRKVMMRMQAWTNYLY